MVLYAFLKENAIDLKARPNYRKEKNKLKTTTGQAATDNTNVKWALFQSLDFLRDQFKPRPMISSMRPAAAQEEEVIGDDTNLSGGVINDSQNEHEGSQSYERLPDANDVTITLTGKQTSSFYHQRPKQFKRNVVEKLINLEERKVTEYERRKRDHLLDADYHFPMSLLPSLKKVKEERKLSVKRKLMDVLFEEEQMCMHRPSTSSSASNYSSRSLSASSNPLPNSPCTSMEYVQTYQELEPVRENDPGLGAGMEHLGQFFSIF
ncbi:hypothetical protein J6590_076338 [Homalodisca vitripennis]|nr:hypothetical protein J6590_076338 [Homalodisca vitripennis]